MTSHFIEYHFKRWGEKHLGIQHYRVFLRGEEIATAIRHGNKAADWYVLPHKWSKGIQGLRSKYAVIEFLQNFVIDDPWRDDPATQGYSEYSVDRRNWTRDKTEDSRYMRFVGVTISFELKN